MIGRTVIGRHRGRRLGIGVAIGLAAAIALSGCESGGSSAAPAGAGGSNTGTHGKAARAAVTITPGDGTKKVRLASTVKVVVADGTIAQVDVTTATGAAVKGTLSTDRTRWASTSALKAATDYTVAVKAANSAGTATEQTAKFTTLTPNGTVTASIVPRSGWTVGVGMPVIVDLSASVSTSRRSAVEAALKVDTGGDHIDGAWHWMTSREVQWRPAEFWPAGTSVKVTADLAGVQVSGKQWGSKKAASSDYTIGSAMISTVDVSGHAMTVRKNGKIIRTIPVTTGKADMATRNGIKVIMSRETSHEMNSASIGIPQGSPGSYDIIAKYAMRLTNSGEFIHAAPWSTGAQGAANVSHGCTGMTTEAAHWLFNRSKVGDVVIYKNSDRKLEWGNGYTAWNESYSEWKA